MLDDGDIRSENALILQETIDNFKSINQESYIIDFPLNISNPYLLLSNSELDPLLDDDIWNAFYEKYPGAHGIIDFSRVGFNLNMVKSLL
jgi:hypothetical protein